MKDSRNLGRLNGIGAFLPWPLVIVPTWVALTSLAAGTVLVSTVNATLFVFAVFAACCCTNWAMRWQPAAMRQATYDGTFHHCFSPVRSRQFPTRCGTLACCNLI